MRLLHAREVKLVEFPNDQIPKYAILSHTWDEQEVTFQDMQSFRSQASRKAGYWKISCVCERAIQDSLSYVWVDTCCIDMSSSAELTEAINSMFLWYRKAKICYAYLADVPTEANPQLFDSLLSNSRWFTRGWTLQELLAPKEIHFYSKDWACIGTKTSLCDKISRITSINSQFLEGVNLQHASIAKKMSWASKRKTTRVEDIAYCLLGIFGVHMPMVYGEGENAFRRLQEEITKVSSDQSIFAWGRAVPRPRWEKYDQRTLWPGLLARSPSDFAYSGDIIPYIGGPDVPFTLTNIGLRIKLPLYEESKNFANAALSCRTENNPWDVLAIRLEKLGNSFRRADDYIPLSIPREEWMGLQITFKEIQLVVNDIGGVQQEKMPSEKDVLLRLCLLGNRKYSVSALLSDGTWKAIESELHPSLLFTGLLFTGEGDNRFFLRCDQLAPDTTASSISISSISHDVKVETLFKANYQCPAKTFVSARHEKHTVDEETFDVALYREQILGVYRPVLDVEVWSRDQMRSKRIQQLMAFRDKTLREGIRTISNI